jgi:hypothetical protein
MGRPAALPNRISEIKFLMADSNSGDFLDRISKLRLYHKIIGFALGKIGSRSLLINYFTARFISFAFLLGAFVFFFLSMKRLAKVWKADLEWSAFLAILIPQVSFVAVGVTPDAFVLFLGACFFYSAIELISGTGGIGHAGLALVSAGSGLFSDRSAMVFVVLLVLLPFFAVRRSNLEKIIPATLLGIVASALVVYALFLRFPTQMESEFLWLKSVWKNSGHGFARIAAPDAFGKKFWLQITDTFFLRFGWMHFGPPAFVVWVWRFCSLCGIGGLMIGLYDSVKLRNQRHDTASDNTRAKMIVFLASGVALQALALWLYFGSARIYPQGRYLFPVLIPIAVFITAGLRRLGDAVKTNLVPAFIVFEIFVWAYALWAIAIPVFRLTVRSPYPGI